MAEPSIMVTGTGSLNHIGTDMCEHYIHSRLRSALPSGPKEIAYSGIVEGNNLRRIASVNSEARTKLFYAPIKSSTSYNGCAENFSNGDVEPVSLVPNNHGLSMNHSVDEVDLVTDSGESSSPVVDSGELSSPVVDSGESSSPVVDSGESSSPVVSAPVVTTPISSPLKLRGPSILNSQLILLKDSRVQIVDVLKKRVSSQPSAGSPPKRLRHSTSPAGYVRRLAAVNARACVQALMNADEQKGSGEVYSKQSLKQLQPSERLGNSNQNNGKNNKDEPGDVRTRDGITHQSVNTSLGLSSNTSADLECTESIPSSNEDDSVHEKSGIILGFEDMPYNCLGLLYNSDTVHVNSVIYFTTLGKLPSVIIPVIVPKTLHEIKNFHSEPQQPRSKKRSLKGDNGWITVGDPIKTIDIKVGGGSKDIINRKYYKGIKRKNEVVFVRDSIVVRSGRKKIDNPYVAKVASIWQESDGIMLTVFWYYRPEDVDEHTAKIFHNHELMGSQHHDDIGVACIDDTCHVLGFTQFCRYFANEQRSEIGWSPKHIVPPPDRNSSNSSENLKDIANESFVYFCCRGYNHITQKVIKIAKQ